MSGSTTGSSASRAWTAGTAWCCPVDPLTLQGPDPPARAHNPRVAPSSRRTLESTTAPAFEGRALQQTYDPTTFNPSAVYPDSCASGNSTGTSRSCDVRRCRNHLSSNGLTTAQLQTVPSICLTFEASTYATIRSAAAFQRPGRTPSRSSTSRTIHSRTSYRRTYEAHASEAV